MTVAIVGTGLIGGSLAMDLRANGFADKLIGVEIDVENKKRALELGLVDEFRDLKEAVEASNIIVLTIPVEAIIIELKKAMNFINTEQTLIDMGSTKHYIVNSVKEHLNFKRYVPTHPMAGTEYSGPDAAIKNLFTNKVAIICDKENCDDDAVRVTEKMYKSLFMKIIYMNAAEHDVHAAYVSHISHISSFLLANTVLEKEQNDENIFNLASGGFESTVRLAKSSPKMWTDVFKQNSDNIIAVLETYLNLLEQFKTYMVNKDFDQIYKQIELANRIKRIIK